MATLVTLEGPEPGRSFPLDGECSVVGRQHDSTICLAGNAVSRHHAQILRRGDDYFIEDLGSSNGTYLNGKRLVPHAPASFYDDDRVQIGPFLLSIQADALGGDINAQEPDLVVRESVSATMTNSSILGPDAASRLHAVLEITKHLARTLDVDQLLHKLLEQLMVLYPQADRSLVVMARDGELDLRAQRTRRPAEGRQTPYSRTIIRRALEEGVGLLSDDVKRDERFAPSVTLTSLELHSVLCAPLITAEGTRLGVIQIDRFCKGFGFKMDDLQLLTAVASQVTVVLENASLHAERMQEERLQRELALAREIQEGFLPDDLDGGDDSFEILGRVFPAQQVAGDFYDFFNTPDGRVGFAIGDVSGKGIPAALFMGSCRTLCRYLAQESLPPSAVLAKLNSALAVDNASCMFVTLIHGVYAPATGEIVISTAGHPPPLLRRAEGQVDELPVSGGRLLGYPGRNIAFAEHRFTLAPGETIVLFTDGLFEAALRGQAQFGDERVRATVASFATGQSLADWAEEAREHVAQFLGGPTLSDDLTLLLLRRRR